MKNLSLFVYVLMLLSSCSRMVVPMGKVPDKHPKPFVTLNNGTKVEPKTVTTKSGKIKTNETAYKKDEVSAYSDGKNTYTSINGEGSFAPIIYEGNINVYQTTSIHESSEYRGRSAADPSGWHTSRSTRVSTYVQKTGTNEFKYLSYKSLKDMISPKEPAFEYLKLYKRHKRVDNAVMAGGLVLFVAGSAMLGKSIMSSTGKGETAGAVVLISGPTAILTGFIMHAFNRLNLQRAVAKHNGIKVE